MFDNYFYVLTFRAEEKQFTPYLPLARQYFCLVFPEISSKMEPPEIFAAPNNLFNITLAVASMRTVARGIYALFDGFNTGKMRILSRITVGHLGHCLVGQQPKPFGMNIRHYSNGRHSMRLELVPEKQTAKLTFEEKTLFSGTFERVEKKMSDVFEIDDEIHPPLFKKLLG